MMYMTMMMIRDKKKWRTPSLCFHIVAERERTHTGLSWIEKRENTNYERASEKSHCFRLLLLFCLFILSALSPL